MERQAIQVPLRTTWSSIVEQNAALLTPLDILRLVNRFPPRSWNFSLYFDAHGRNHLSVRCEPALGPGEIVALLDGEVPSLYSFGPVGILTDGAKYLFDPSSMGDGEGRATSLQFTRAPAEQLVGQLKVVGFDAVGLLQDHVRLEAWLKTNTWFGSRRFAGRRHTLVLKIFGYQETYKTEPGGAVASAEPHVVFERAVCDDGQLLGQVILECSSEGQHEIRHERYGAFDLTTAVPDFWRRTQLARESTLTIEVNAAELSWFSSAGPRDLGRLRRLGEAILSLEERLQHEAEYRTYQERASERAREKAAQKLLRRQKRLEHSHVVLYKGQRLMVSPTCENELVALYMKLEVLGALPVDCEVLEYTSRAGIDALGHFRLDPGEAWTRSAPIEFEILLENFFEHQHPIEQTALIICWDADRDTARARGVRFDRRRRWLGMLASARRNIPVLMLRHIPNIVISK